MQFLDRVKVKSNLNTERLGLAGLTGQIYGDTTPSVTEIEVIGPLINDRALEVFFEELKTSYWFPEEYLEFADHAPGTEVSVQDTKLTRREDGTWKNESR